MQNIKAVEKEVGKYTHVSNGDSWDNLLPHLSGVRNKQNKNHNGMWRNCLMSTRGPWLWIITFWIHQAHLLRSVTKCLTIFMFKWSKSKIIRKGDDRDSCVWAKIIAELIPESDTARMITQLPSPVRSTSGPSVVQALDHSTRSGLREEAGRVAGSDQQGWIKSPAWKKSQHFSSRHFHHRNNSTKLCPKVIFWLPRGLDDGWCQLLRSHKAIALTVKMCPWKSWLFSDSHLALE